VPGRGRGGGGSLVGGGGSQLEVKLDPPLLAEQGEETPSPREAAARKVWYNSSTVGRSGAAEVESRVEVAILGC
jgi:hypothetical protein